MSGLILTCSKHLFNHLPTSHSSIEKKNHVDSTETPQVRTDIQQNIIL